MAEQFPSLTDPDACPGKNVVIFDGNCQFCQGQVQHLARLDLRRKLTFLSLHDARVAVRFPQFTFQQLMEQMWVVTPSGETHGGFFAVRYLSRQLVLLWPLALLWHIPGTAFFWHQLYALVARNRYRWNKVSSCENNSCQIHFPGRQEEK